MAIALATGQPLDQLLKADSVTIATWIELLDERAEMRR